MARNPGAVLRAFARSMSRASRRDRRRRSAAEPGRCAVGRLLGLMDGGGLHADLGRGNLLRPADGERFEKVVLELRRPVMAGGGGDMRGIVRGVVHRFVLSVG